MTLIITVLGILFIWWYIHEFEPELELSILARIKRWIRQDVARRVGRLEAKKMAKAVREFADEHGFPSEDTEAYIARRTPNWIESRGQLRAREILGEEHWLETDY
jgi:hypothetical protein